VQVKQDATHASWRNGALIAAVIALLLVGAAVGVLSRAEKTRRGCQPALSGSGARNSA
jgi:VIT1/CCC1 family predicted Fe2+/Mn2+ transporter